MGNYKPDSIDNLFISIQTFNSQDFTAKTTPEFYDYIIVDEFHHAAADSYQELLAYYEPKILLGLTATPDRMDGKDILKYFDGRIASKLLLGEAIDRNLLSPFQYLGVTDDTDYRNFKWTRGKYDVSELEKVYTADTRRCALILNSVKKYVTDISSVKGLVSVLLTQITWRNILMIKESRPLHYLRKVQTIFEMMQKQIC